MMAIDGMLNFCPVFAAEPHACVIRGPRQCVRTLPHAGRAYVCALASRHVPPSHPDVGFSPPGSSKSCPAALHGRCCMCGCTTGLLGTYSGWVCVGAMFKHYLGIFQVDCCVCRHISLLPATPSCLAGGPWCSAGTYPGSFPRL